MIVFGHTAKRTVCGSPTSNRGSDLQFESLETLNGIEMAVDGRQLRLVLHAQRCNPEIVFGNRLALLS